MSTLDEIYQLVREIEAATAQAEVQAAALGSKRFVADIRPELGTVSVNGFGALVSIELNRRNLPVTTEQVLGRAIVDAINSAEAQADAARGGAR
ncbi:MAG: hypothetical protein ACRDTG_00085 [Pseudonocardiaceae bacterium]